MRRKVEYSRQTLSTPNPIARFAHKKRYSFSLALAKKFLKDGQSLLDYGCGTGDFLNKVETFGRNLQLYGFDPESKHSSEKYQIVVNIVIQLWFFRHDLC
ncbi:MAG: methyltransferase domain-containing protein [Candidatus Electrothrix sp. LOE1_4_5]|nr:methyltransferase domain-containing protein [Candidatus Electrothrix gigas]